MNVLIEWFILFAFVLLLVKAMFWLLAALLPKRKYKAPVIEICSPTCDCLPKCDVKFTQ